MKPLHYCTTYSTAYTTLHRLLALSLAISALPLTAHVSDWLPSPLRRLADEEEQVTAEFPIKAHATITLQIIHGNVTIEHWSKPQVLIQLTKRARTHEELQQTHHDKEGNLTPFTVTHEPHALSLTVAPEQGHIMTDITIMIPGTASIAVRIDGEGECNVPAAPRGLKVYTKSGNIEITTTLDGNINATTEHGSITTTCEAFHIESSVMLSAPRGAITLSLPAHVCGRIDARSQRGMILSQLPITFDPFTIKLDKQSWKQLQRHAKGFIGTDTKGEACSEAPITLTARNNISIKIGDA